MSIPVSALQEQITEIKSILADISATIAEMQKRPCQIKGCTKTIADCDAMRLPRPFERVPNTYTLMLDVQDTEDDLCITGVIHLLPGRGKAQEKQVTDSAVHGRTQTHALLATLGSTLKAIVAYCPEKLVIYTNSKVIVKILKKERTKLKEKKEKEAANYLAEDLIAINNMFPVEVQLGLPEGFKDEIKSLIAQTELEYIRQKEKVDVVKRTRSDQNSRGA